MITRTVVTLATGALAAGVFVSGANAAPPLCGSKQCAEEITAACGSLSGADFRACKQLVLDQCKISGETFCSCTNPALPACAPATSTTTTSTTTTTQVLEFTTGTPGGTCGNTLDGSNVLIANLTCGGLNIGGSNSIVPEGPISDGSTSRFALSCTGASCTIGPTSTAPPVNTADPDCTDIGCNFGAPMAIPPPFTALFNFCVLSTWSAPASGTLDLTSGTSSTNVALNFDVYTNASAIEPCPRCSATGTPSQPGTGTCDRGPRAGMACTTTSSTGLTRDCPTGGVGTPATPCPVGNGTGSGNCCPTPATCNCPCTPGGGNCCDGAHLGVIPIDLSPLTTGTASATDPGGLFCPGQAPPGMERSAGCFSSTLGEFCRTITERGVAAGPIFTGVPADATLASVFCIAATGDGFIDGTFGLPGPGAVSLPGTILVHN